MVRSHSFQGSSVEMSEILVQSPYGQYKVCTDGTQQNKWDNTLMLQFMSETASKWVSLTPRLGRSVRSMIDYVLDSCRQTLHLELAVQIMKVPLIPPHWKMCTLQSAYDFASIDVGFQYTKIKFRCDKLKIGCAPDQFSWKQSPPWLWLVARLVVNRHEK